MSLPPPTACCPYNTMWIERGNWPARGGREVDGGDLEGQGKGYRGKRMGKEDTVTEW